MSPSPADGGSYDAVIAAAQIAAHGVEQVTDVVEDVHARIARPRWARRGEPRRTRGITGFVYRSIRLVTRGTFGVLKAGGSDAWR